MTLDTLCLDIQQAELSRSLSAPEPNGSVTLAVSHCLCLQQRRKRLFSVFFPLHKSNDHFCMETLNWRGLMPSPFIECMWSTDSDGSSKDGSAEVVFSQNHDWNGKVYILYKGSPTGWHPVLWMLCINWASKSSFLMTHYKIGKQIWTSTLSQQ